MKIKLFCACVLISNVLITGCSNDNDSDPVVATSKKQLKNIDAFSSTDQGLTLNQVRHDKLTYINNRLSKVDIFAEKGIDQAWGTTDDVLASTVKCSFSGQVSGALRDPRLEFQMPKLTAFTGNGNLALIMLTPYTYPSSYCALDYKNDLAFTEDQFIPALSVEANKDKPSVSSYWKALQANNVRAGSQNLTLLSGMSYPDCEIGNSVCDLLNFGIDNNKTTFNYSGSDIIIDPIKHLIHRYTFEKDNIKTETVYKYDGDVNTALSKIDTLTVISNSQIERTATLVRTCTTANLAINSSQVIETLNNGIVVQKDLLSAGDDGKACTADDFIVSREKYSYQ